MKRLIYSLTLVFALGISANTATANDRSNKKKPEMTAEQRIQFERIVNRVEEIRDIDKSQLSSSERSELRKELRDLKAQARASNGGVYLSVGAIVVIIVLLLILL